MILQRLLQDSRGVVSVIVGFGILALVGAVGVAVDVGRGQMAQTKLQNALDAAGLAAGATVNSSDITAEVTKYLNVNFTQGTLGATITRVSPVLSGDGKLLTVAVDARMPTTFMKIFSRTTMDLHAETEVTRSSKGMELAMVLDITGSMAGTKLTSLKTASNDLLDILFGQSNASADNLWVGIVPFSMGVNVGPSRTNWLDPSATRDWGTTSWRGCTEARWSTGRDLTDATPAAERFLPYYWQDDANNNWIGTTNDTSTTNTTLCGPTNASSCRCTSNGGSYACGTTTSGNTSTTISCSGSSPNRRCNRAVTTTTPRTTYTITSSVGPNTYCPTNEVTTLTNVRSTLNSAITALTAVGGTHIPVGAVWGWRLLSPGWRGLWGGAMNTNNLPLDYNSDLMIKAMILMTDGENTMYSNSDGAYGYTGQNYTGMTSTPYTDAKAAQRLDAKLAQICTNMKQRGIIIYTVVFDLNSTAVDNMMRTCASQPDYYFNAPDSATLRQAFRTIGDSLSNLRISR